MLRDSVAKALFDRPVNALDSQMIKECNTMINLYWKIKKLEEKE